MVGMVVGEHHGSNLLQINSVGAQSRLHDVGFHAGINQHPALLSAQIATVAA